MKNLIYCTACYPSDVYTEKVFVDTEIAALQKYFGHIIIVPLKSKGRTLGFDRNLPEGVTVDWSVADAPAVQSRLRKLAHGCTKPFFRQSLRVIPGETKNPRRLLKGMFQAANTVNISEILRDIAIRNNCNPADTVLYSLWFNDGAAAMAYLAEKEGWPVATRAHTSDIYDEWMLFRSAKIRNRHLRNIRKVLVICSKGTDYLKKKFPENADKINLLHLGSRRLYDYSPESRNDRSGDRDEVTVMTVGTVDERKRPPLIFKILNRVAELNPERTIRWKVAGDGPLMPELRSLVSKVAHPNLKVELFGRLENPDIQRIYASGAIDWFMMMSTLEGIPVSIGEAMSYGIPVITTDVDSIPELVNEECGHLYPADISKEACAESISGYLFDRTHRDRLGAEALRQWEEKFNATIQADRLAQELNNLLLDP